MDQEEGTTLPWPRKRYSNGTVTIAMSYTHHVSLDLFAVVLAVGYPYSVGTPQLTPELTVKYNVKNPLAPGALFTFVQSSLGLNGSQYYMRAAAETMSSEWDDHMGTCLRVTQAAFPDWERPALKLWYPASYVPTPREVRENREYWLYTLRGRAITTGSSCPDGKPLTDECASCAARLESEGGE